jgi:hypothetical protein
MTLHIDSSSIRNQNVLAHVLDPVDVQTPADADADASVASSDQSTTDSAAISASGQRLSSIDESSDVDAVNDAESLVRSISASLTSGPSATAAALHGSIDRSRAAALLLG